MYELIKMVHHIGNVSTQVEPPTIRQLVDFMSNVIAQALPTHKTQTLLKGNTRNWGYTIQQILEDHYVSGIEHVCHELEDYMDEDWDRAFEVAGKWARRDLGCRSKPDTMEQTSCISNNGTIYTGGGGKHTSNTRISG